MSGQTNALSFYGPKNILTNLNSFEPVQIVLDRPTLDSGINIGVSLLIFGFFSGGYVLIQEINP